MKNKKLTLQYNDGSLKYCVVSPAKNYDTQLNITFGYEGNCGISVRLCPDEVAFVDYFHNEKISSIKIVSFEDTDLEVCLELKEIK